MSVYYDKYHNDFKRLTIVAIAALINFALLILFKPLPLWALTGSMTFMYNTIFMGGMIHRYALFQDEADREMLHDAVMRSRKHKGLLFRIFSSSDSKKALQKEKTRDAAAIIIYVAYEIVFWYVVFEPLINDITYDHEMLTQNKWIFICYAFLIGGFVLRLVYHGLRNEYRF